MSESEAFKSNETAAVASVISSEQPTFVDPNSMVEHFNDPMHQPREIKLISKNGSFGFHLKGPMKSGTTMRYLNGRLFPPLHYIYSMDQYSMAIKSGLKIYDTILEINDIDVAGLSFNSVQELIEESEKNGQIKLKVMYPDNINTVKEFTEAPSIVHDIESSVENMKHLLKSLYRSTFSSEAPQSIEMLHKIDLNLLLEKEKNHESATASTHYLHPLSKKIDTTYYSDGNLVDIICIPVVRFLKCYGRQCAFYDIYQGDKFLVSRRFNDFKSYDKHMRSLVDDFPLLPSGWFLSMNHTQIDNRRLELESYIKQVSSSLILLKLAPTRLFLGLGSDKYNERILVLCDPSKETSDNDSEYSEGSNDSTVSVERNKQHLMPSTLVTTGSVDAIFSSCDSLNLPNFQSGNKKSAKFLISIILADHSFRLPLVVYEHQTVFSVFKDMCKEFNFPPETMKYFALFHCPTNRNGGVVLRKNCVPFQIFLQDYIRHHRYSLCIKRWGLETDKEDIFLKTPLLVNILYSQLCYDIKYGNMDEKESVLVPRPVAPDLPTKIQILKTSRNLSSYATFRVNIDSFTVNEILYTNCVIILSPFTARICLDSETDSTTIFSFSISDVGKPRINENNSSSQQSLQLDINDVNQYSVIIVSSNLGYLLRCLKKVFKTRERMSVVSIPNNHPI